MPTTGGTLPNNPYAIPWGICMMATVIPLIRSPKKFFLQLYLGSHFNTGIEFRTHESGLISLIFLPHFSVNVVCGVSYSVSRFRSSS
jgi:hypothetical protein